MSLLKTLQNKLYKYYFGFCFVSVSGNDGFYVILKGLARPQADPYKNLMEDIKSATSFTSSKCYSFIYNEDFKNTSITDSFVPTSEPKVKPLLFFKAMRQYYCK